MQVGVRAGDAWLWQATDAGSFNFVRSVVIGSTIDFAVYGGYIAGNTPLVLRISEIRPRFTQIQKTTTAFVLGVTNLVIGASNDLQCCCDLLVTDWTNLVTFTSTEIYTNLVDETAGTIPARYYRLIAY